MMTVGQLVWLLRRGLDAAAPLVLVAGLFLALAGGLADVTVLTRSQLPTTLPASRPRQFHAHRRLREGLDVLILMDENGLHQSSVEFAQWLDKKQMSVNGNLLFVIGGAYGFSEAVYDRANAKLSLSKMTFSHQMVRMIFLEQLYRAYSILKGEPYHHS